MTRACSTCSVPIGAKNASGLCRGCVSRRNAIDPAFQARRVAGIRARFDDPEYRREHTARCIANTRNLSEEARQRRRENGKLNADILRAANRATAG